MTTQPVSNVNIVLGAMSIGKAGAEAVGVTTHEDARALLDVFQQHGHTEVDTTRIYADGTSEEYLAALDWQKRGLRMDTKLHPGPSPWKMPEIYTHSAADLRKGLMASLAALKTEKVYMFYLHSPERSTPYEDTLREVDALYREGRFERFALSNYQSWEVARICEICSANGWVRPSAYQGLYHALQRGVEPELIPCLRQYGLAFYAYNPLAGGFLTGRYRRRGRALRSEQDDREDAPGAVLERAALALDLLRAAAEKAGISETEVALRWLAHHSVLKKEHGDAVIVGAGSAKHLEENLVALDKGPLPVEVVQALNAGWEKTKTLPSQYYR